MSARRLTLIVTIVSALVVASASIVWADPGDVDETFGDLGLATNDLPGFDLVNGIDRQSTGKIIVAGDVDDSMISVFRLLPGGDLDTGFGSGGSTLLAIPGGTSFLHTWDMAIQGNDRIVVVAGAEVTTGHDPFVIARFLADGTPDPSFGVGGVRKVTFSLGDATSLGVAIQPNGRIVVVGEADLTQDHTRFVAIRLRANGVLDTTFGNGGRKIVALPDSFAGRDEAFRVRAMPDGRLVLAGSNEVAGGFRTVVVRLRSGGGLDPTFSGDGIATVDVRPHADDEVVALELAGGKIVLGVSGLLGEAVAIRLRGNGARDTTFSGDGIAKLAQPGFDVTDLAVLGDGRVLLCSLDGRVMRLTATGSRNLSFGTNGVAQNPAMPGGQAIELQASKVLFASGSGGNSYVTRFLG